MDLRLPVCEPVGDKREGFIDLALRSKERVVAGSTQERIVTSGTVEQVPAALTKQQVASALPSEPVISATAESRKP